MLVARESAFSRMSRCNLRDVTKITFNYCVEMTTNSRMNFCRVSTVDLLHVLKASEAAATACSNSSLVVSGTRESSVRVDYCNVT